MEGCKIVSEKKVGEEDFFESESKCKEGNDGLKRKNCGKKFWTSQLYKLAILYQHIFNYNALWIDHPSSL